MLAVYLKLNHYNDEFSRQIDIWSDPWVLQQTTTVHRSRVETVITLYCSQCCWILHIHRRKENYLPQPFTFHYRFLYCDIKQLLHTHTHARTHARAHTYIYTRTHAHARAHTYIHTYTHSHTDTLPFKPCTRLDSFPTSRF